MNYDTYWINSAITFDTIALRGNSTEAICGGAVIRLIAGAGFSFGSTATGNVKASGGTRAVGSVATLVYHPATGAWYES